VDDGRRDGSLVDPEWVETSPYRLR